MIFEMTVIYAGNPIAGSPPEHPSFFLGLADPDGVSLAIDRDRPVLCCLVDSSGIEPKQDFEAMLKARNMHKPLRPGHVLFETFFRFPGGLGKGINEDRSRFKVSVQLKE